MNPCSYRFIPHTPLILACVGLLTSLHAEVRLPALLSDHMVLQREKPVRIWGSAEPGESITVELAGQSKNTKTDEHGQWNLFLDPLSAAENLTMTVHGKNTVTVKDVMVGEVWLCSGQSNMGVPVDHTVNGAEEARAANEPSIRIITLPSKAVAEPVDETPNLQMDCLRASRLRGTSPRWRGFMRWQALHQELRVPIGIVHSAVGGSPINGWISRSALEEVPGEGAAADRALARMKSQDADAKAYPAKRAEWETRYHVQPPENTGFVKGWADPAFDDHDWKTAAFPASWEEAADVKTGGVFWLRKEVSFAPEVAGKPFSINLNYMHGQDDTTYFNGVEIGHSGDKPPLYDMSARSYDVPKALVKAGRNVIAIRVVSPSQRYNLLGRGAFGDYNLPANRRQVGNVWRLNVESLFPAIPYEAYRDRPRPNDSSPQTVPTALYNAMIHPLLPFCIRGAIWYQGESNTRRPEIYASLFSTMIRDWRKRWGLGDFPIYYVQLPNYSPVVKDPNENSQWAKLRAAQAEVLHRESNLGMAVTIDVGERDNLHPIDKQDVGARLARLALVGTYGRKMETSGPAYESMTAEPGRIRLHFSHAEGLAGKGGPLRRFAIAGDDHKFVWTDAVIEGKDVIVSSPSVSHPLAVRYAWADNPEGCNLINGEGLPAAPFRTDDWPLN